MKVEGEEGKVDCAQSPEEQIVNEDEQKDHNLAEL
jgi:hypothetical protein